MRKVYLNIFPPLYQNVISASAQPALFGPTRTATIRPMQTPIPACSCAAAPRAARSSMRRPARRHPDPRPRAAGGDGFARQAPDRRPGRRPPADQQGRHRLQGLPAQHDPGVDLDFLFAQLQPDKDTVDTTPNCGNMLAAVVPFALETGLVKPQGDTTTLRVLTLNTDMQCDITVQTPAACRQLRGRCPDRRRARQLGADHHQLPRHRRLGLFRPAAHRPRAEHGDGNGCRLCAVHAGRHLHRQRDAAGDVPRRRCRPHRLRIGGRTERRHRVERAYGGAAAACIAADGPGRREPEELSEDDADSPPRHGGSISTRAASSRTSATTRSACWPP